MALWRCTDEVPLSAAALLEIETGDLRLSPMVLMEMQFFHEIGRLNAGPSEWLTILRGDFDVVVCALPFQAVTEASHNESWMRVPFDRVIVAHAKAGGGKLITKHRRIRHHYPNSVW